MAAALTQPSFVSQANPIHLDFLFLFHVENRDASRIRRTTTRDAHFVPGQSS
jgi:hypothetical protein